MIKYIARVTLFCLTVIVFPAVNQFSIKAEDKPPGFIYTRWIDKAVFKGIAEIYILEKEAGGDILFSPKDNQKIYYKSINGKGNFAIFEMDYRNKTRRIVIDPNDYFPKEKKGYSNPFSYQFLNTNTMICLASDAYKEDKDGGVDYVDKIFKLNLDTNKLDMEIKKYGISRFGNYSQRSVATFSNSGKIETFDYDKNISRTFSVPRPEVFGDNIRIEQIVLGRSDDELIVKCRRVEKNDVGEVLGRTRIAFYNAKKDKLVKILILPFNATNNPQIKFTGGNLYLMPNNENIILWGNTGLWLYSIKTNELICLIWWNEITDLTPKLADISWDSSNLLLYARSPIHDYIGLYILNINEFLKYQPEGQKIFFSPDFSNKPGELKPGFISN